MAMGLKTALQYSVRHNLSAEEVNDLVTVAWRFAFGVMQPWSVNTNNDLLCGCQSPDLLDPTCTWHGVQAQKMAHVN